MKTQEQTSHSTTDHEFIRQWVELRGGKPSMVERTAKAKSKGETTGIIRIDMPGYSGAGSLEEISWEQWFETFEASKLAFVYQEKTADGKLSNFSKLVSR